MQDIFNINTTVEAALEESIPAISPFNFLDFRLIKIYFLFSLISSAISKTL